MLPLVGHRWGVVSAHCRFDEPRRASACSRHDGPRRAKHSVLPRPRLLRLAERHRDPGGVRVDVHRLVDRYGDEVGRRARRNRSLWSEPSGSLGATQTAAHTGVSSSVGCFRSPRQDRRVHAEQHCGSADADCSLADPGGLRATAASPGGPARSLHARSPPNPGARWRRLSNCRADAAVSRSRRRRCF